MAWQYKLFSPPAKKSFGAAPSAGSDIPIMIETLGRPFFPMVRCDYLSFEYTEPHAGWAIRFDGGAGMVPFLMLELVGIIQRPIRQATFDESVLIDELFEELEDKAGLLVNFEDIWLPRFLFNRELEIGDVFRIDNNLFQYAYAFREGRLTEDIFVSGLKRLGGSVTFSGDETRAFADWSSKQVFRALHAPPKNLELQLRKREG